MGLIIYIIICSFIGVLIGGTAGGNIGIVVALVLLFVVYPIGVFIVSLGVVAHDDFKHRNDPEFPDFGVPTETTAGYNLPKKK